MESELLQQVDRAQRAAHEAARRYKEEQGKEPADLGRLRLASEDADIALAKAEQMAGLVRRAETASWADFPAAAIALGIARVDVELFRREFDASLCLDDGAALESSAFSARLTRLCVASVAGDGAAGATPLLESAASAAFLLLFRLRDLNGLDALLAALPAALPLSDESDGSDGLSLAIASLRRVSDFDSTNPADKVNFVAELLAHHCRSPPTNNHIAVVPNSKHFRDQLNAITAQYAMDHHNLSSSLSDTGQKAKADLVNLLALCRGAPTANDDTLDSNYFDNPPFVHYDGITNAHAFVQPMIVPWLIPPSHIPLIDDLSQLPEGNLVCMHWLLFNLGLPLASDPTVFSFSMAHQNHAHNISKKSDFDEWSTKSAENDVENNDGDNQVKIDLSMLSRVLIAGSGNAPPPPAFVQQAQLDVSEQDQEILRALEIEDWVDDEENGDNRDDGSGSGDDEYQKRLRDLEALLLPKFDK
ncbi:hypothetical protein HK100_003865 [Physocladia obscura]|uniref:Uncharacterized protein n=1 Tax=Physocladia obscura TaxID=109957 RepID=A0AAD5TAW4_9FUNG|nr:hypothetical protein HK100_003865 [Physocladia obscura]